MLDDIVSTKKQNNYIKFLGLFADTFGSNFRFIRSVKLKKNCFYRNVHKWESKTSRSEHSKNSDSFRAAVFLHMFSGSVVLCL